MSTLTDLIEKALRLEVDSFQCFFVIQGTRRLIQPDITDLQNFLALRRKHFKNLYVHGSYWINLSSSTLTRHWALERELKLAKQFEFTHMILHPGSAKDAKTKSDGIDALARTLNSVLKREHEIKLVLENTAHGNLSVGGDLYDFKQLLEKIDHPEKLSFCIDTAHAHSYGYDITQPDGRAEFITLVDDIMGLDNVVLIHLNDTREKLGSQLDRHYSIGDGIIGHDALKAFAQDPHIESIPLLMEPPVASEQEEMELLTMVKNWER